ncbi:MAG: hypothetical protein L6W00_08195 [Lentisphaeria bacterium]|nr:MAG: hypothetical protein L6W00_08195 [Lentisphaeria bacterium]
MEHVAAVRPRHVRRHFVDPPFAGTLFLLLVGLFWSVGAPAGRAPVVIRFPRLRMAASALLFLAAILTAVPAFFSGLFLREAKEAHFQRDLDRALLALNRSMDWKLTPENLYVTAAIRLFDRKDPTAAIRLYRQLPATGLAFYSHSDGRLARALTVLGEKREALAAFEREQQRFPLQCAQRLLPYDGAEEVRTAGGGRGGGDAVSGDYALQGAAAGGAAAADPQSGGGRQPVGTSHHQEGGPVTLNEFILSLQAPPLQALSALFLLLAAAYGIGTLLLRRYAGAVRLPCGSSQDLCWGSIFWRCCSGSGSASSAQPLRW